MAGSVHTEAYSYLLSCLIQARQTAGFSQAQLAKKLGKPASFVGKYELAERRLDVIELIVVLRVLNEPLAPFIKKLQSNIPDQL